MRSYLTITTLFLLSFLSCKKDNTTQIEIPQKPTADLRLTNIYKDEGNNIAIEYNNDNLVESIAKRFSFIQKGSETIITQRIRYEYNSNYNIVKSYTDDNTIAHNAYEYDNANRLVKHYSIDRNRIKHLVNEYAYYGNHITKIYGYKYDTGELTSITDYTYEGDNITSEQTNYITVKPSADSTVRFTKEKTNTYSFDNHHNINASLPGMSQVNAVYYIPNHNETTLRCKNNLIKNKEKHLLANGSIITSTFIHENNYQYNSQGYLIKAYGYSYTYK